MSGKLDYAVKKLEKGPLQRFKNQNAVLKKFGENGLKFYRAATGRQSAAEIAAQLGLDADFAAEVAGWLEEAGMVELEIAGSGPAEGRQPAKKKEPRAQKEKEEPEAPPAEPEEPEEEEKPKVMHSRLREIVEQEAGKDEGLAKEEERPAKRKAEEEHEEEEEKKPARKKASDEIVPISDEGELSTSSEKRPNAGEREGETGPAEEEENKEGEETEPKREEEGEIPEDRQEKKEETAEEPAAGEEREPEAEEKKEEGEREETVSGEESKSETGEEEPKADEEEIAPEAESGEEEKTAGEGEDLNPVEKTIKEKYGEAGLKVYALIDGQKTAEEIMSETGVSEAKLIEMLEFMEKQGIIKLEHPEAKGGAGPAEEEKDRFAPLEEESPAGAMKDLSPAEIPTRVKADIIGGLQAKTKVALQYGERGTKILNQIDGTLSDVDLTLKTGVPLYEVRDFLSFLSSNRIITVRQMDRAEIVKRYGEDCFSIYKKYGREGVLLYELIGKDLAIGQMAVLVTKEKDKFADMFIFVHRVLGIDIPIDRDVIYAQIEGKR